jgi:C4-type Zn-finger protein
MGICSTTPRIPCPFCGHEDIYAGTILVEVDEHDDMVLGEVRCQDCEVSFREYWEDGRGEDYDSMKLEKLVAKWNRLDGGRP